MKELPNAEMLAELGFVKINNSMWRKENITLQPTAIFEGDTFIDKILNTKSAFKVCIDKKFNTVITTFEELQNLIK